MQERNWIDFGQVERLTVRLKELIRNYPRGIGIVKEFIQNADDAGACSLSILLDMRTHPARNLHDGRMKVLLGPALLIANESLFSQRDFESIQHIGESNKTESGPKTGRFGLGFNTCYNVTDYPSFVTGEDAVCFDPHQNAIARPGGQPGVRAALKDVWESSPDWLAAFTVAGLIIRASHHNGTIFRLPLRTTEQALVSEISKESFGREAFHEIVSQLRTIGPELLLFTKHLHSIRVLEVDEVLGTPRVLLEIATVNVDDVTAARARVLSSIAGCPLPELLTRWRDDPSALPCVTYTHCFKVTEEHQVWAQSWRVCSGLFCDQEKKLLDAAEAMLNSGEKALPWAGAAAKLVTTEGTLSVERVDGRVYCGMPLSDETPLPVHINAYFDLDSSRRALSADRNVIGANRARVEWNERLMQHGVASAYATLLLNLRDAAEGNPSAFYETFPNIDAMGSQLLSILGRSIFAELAKRPTIKAVASGRSKWLPIQEVWLVREPLKAPLIAEGKPIPDPSLPLYVRRGFEAVGQSLNILTPKALREFLRTQVDIDTPLEASPRPCLRQREWVEELLRFCLEDGGDNSLHGLPVALLCDGNLHTFGYSKAGQIFSASEEQRRIFEECPHWFIDPEFERSVGLKEQPKSKFTNMTAATVIANLGAILGKESSGKVIDWCPEESNTPNAEWLTSVFEYLTKVSAVELSQTLTTLHQWPLLPDQENRLHPLNSVPSPALRPVEPVFKKLVTSLELLGIPLLSGAPTLIDGVRRFAAAHPKCLNIELTGVRLVNALAACKLKLDEHSSAHDPKIHDPLLSFLSDDRFFATYTDGISGQLRALPLFPTISGAITRADSPDVFVSTNYAPPSCSPSVTLLKSGPDGKWKKLLHKLNVPRLDQQTLIERVLLPKYAAIKPDDQIAILRWVKDHLSAEVVRLDKSTPGSGQKLLQTVREAELVRCIDGTLHKGGELYDPREPIIREVLGDRAAIPDTSLYDTADPSWIAFFELLGAEKTPRAKDLLDYIDSLALEGKDGTAVVSARLMELFDFLQKNWSRLAAVPVSDGKIVVEFRNALKNRAWLPAQRSIRQDEYPGFLPQEDRLYRPSEIYPSRLIHQVGSVLPVLLSSRDVEREVRTALDMPFQAPLNAVLKHFDRLLELWHQPEHSGIKSERIGASFKEIYRYFGGLAAQAQDEPGKAELALALTALQTRYEGRPSVWDAKASKLWNPEHVFVEKVPFFEPRRAHVVYSDDRVNTGLAALGRRVSPTGDDFRQFLRDLEMELGEVTPSDIEQSQILYALKHIADSEPAERDEIGLPLLNQSGRLAAGDTLLWEDTTRWRGKVDLSLVPLVHDQVPPALLARAGVQRMSEHIRECLVSEPEPCNGYSLEQLCDFATSTIHSEEFAKALQRLVRYQRGVDLTNADLVSLIRVTAASSIQVEATLLLNGSVVALGEFAATYFFRADDATLFVSGSSERQLLVALSKAVNALLHPELSDLAPLQDMLRATASEIAGILDDYEIPAIQSAGEFEVMFDEDGSTEDFDYSDEDQSVVSDDTANQPRNNADTEEARTAESPRTKPASKEGRQPPEGAEFQDRTPNAEPGRSSSRVAQPRPAFGTDDRPPTTPGSGRSEWQRPHGEPARGDGQSRHESAAGLRSTAQRGRIVTYVEGALNENVGEPRSSEADDIGDAAVNHVMKIEKDAGRDPVEMDHDNEGFDILAKDSDGRLRYIEVKGIDGTWGDSGVPVSRSQFLWAQRERKQFWLYVVENARSKSPTLHCINDPATKITQYRFDSGWKALAAHTIAQESSTSGPAVGMRVEYDDGTGTVAAGTVTNLERSGLIVRVHIRTDAGTEVKKFINASMRFSEPEGEAADAENAARTD